MPSSNWTSFCETLAVAKHLVVLTGAGVSAESGIPTFRGAGGYWRRYEAQNLATPQAFRSNPSLVWEFYHHRREVALTKSPNPAHTAIAKLQAKFLSLGKNVSVITQNINELHQRAGSLGVIELHGSLFKTRCTKCKSVVSNYDSPICEALRGRGAPQPDALSSEIDVHALPRCREQSCGGLLRPHIVWFGENLDSSVLQSAHDALDTCDVCMVLGTSSVVYPAAMFAPQLAERDVPVAEFNLEETPATDNFQYHFSGPCGTTLPLLLSHLKI